jgi:hypothetical protein
MQYVPPYGVSDPNASYVNGNPTIGVQGSIPPAAVFEDPQREIVAVITKSGVTPSEADLVQLTKAIRSQFLNYAEDTGSLNHLSVSYDPPIGQYTKGLVLHVLLKYTNTGGCDINAGAGVVPVRKMNGAEVQANDLSAGGLCQLMFDGTVFQLTNFLGLGGGTGVNDVFMVKIPYCVDTSTTPGVITAPFSPPITTMVAGDMIAVKVANTAPGPTHMNINALPAINLAPNGGGIMLQGDVHIGDVVIFFYDGTNLYFAPNPFIDAPVTYTVGTGQQFPDPPTAIDAVRRKTIGANGHLTFQLAHQVFQPFTINHPSADRITIQGTMLGPNPQKADFHKTGTDPNEPTYNLTMLRSKFGTEIDLNPAATYASPSIGFVNGGPGMPTLKDILIVGNRPPTPDYRYSQAGVFNNAGFQMALNNVSVWGASVGFVNNGSMYTTWCFAVHNMSSGIVGGLEATSLDNTGAYGNLLDGFFMGKCSGQYNETVANGRFGISDGGGTVNLWWHNAYANGSIDLYAVALGYMAMVFPYTIQSTSPPFNVIGNSGALITLTT